MTKIKEINLNPLTYFLLGALIWDILTTNHLSYENTKYLVSGLLIILFWKMN